ncbi:HEAT repeat domain-containing protein [Candidatus Micrarchaeota archaeon]|nr:HEAT repeat domain-containing protein [Candidatus Micrarchaeota archaeon]
MEEKEIKELIKQLSDKDWKVKESAIEILRLNAQEGYDISIAIPALGDSLSDKGVRIRLKSAEALKFAAKKGINTTSVVSKLGEALFDKDQNVKEEAAWALGYTARNRVDTSPAIPALVKALSDGNLKVEWRATQALRNAVGNCKTRKQLRELLRKFKGSPEAKALSKEFYGYWMRNRNEKIELRIDKEMRRPNKKTIKGKIKRAVTN